MEDFPSIYNLGIIGSGQVARMTYQAALSLGFTPKLLAEDLGDSAALVAKDAKLSHPDTISNFAELCEVLTFQHEQVDIGLVRALESNGSVFRPSIQTLQASFDKLYQRRILSMKGYSVPDFTEFKGPDDLIDFTKKYTFPIAIKAVKSITDSKSQVWFASNESEAIKILKSHGNNQLMLEEYQQILAELVVIVVRRPGGNKVAYNIAQFSNNESNTCKEVIVPAEIGPNIANEAREIAFKISDDLNAVGVFAVEIFLTDVGLVVNEVAARPHNAGHHTIESSTTSQFENHVRAVLDLPLGITTMRANAAATVNVIGTADGTNPTEHLAETLAIEGAHIHLYGKLIEPGRKLGHVTALADTIDDAREIARRAEATLMGRRHY